MRQTPDDLIQSKLRRHTRPLVARGYALLFFSIFTFLNFAQPTPALPIALRQSELTPLQHEIQIQTARLASPDVEERRDAVTRLGAMTRPEASRAAATALGDSSAIIRATAARAILSLGAGEASTLIIPLLSDRDEFVRREAAYALGLTRSALGVPALVTTLGADKKPSVRAAAAIALGQINDAQSVPALVAALTRRLPATGFFNRVRRRKVEEDDFVRRAAAISLGQMNNGKAVPALVETLSDARTPADIRREAARALGIIGDPTAVPALRAALTSKDPYLAQIAFEALRRISPQDASQPNHG